MYIAGGGGIILWELEPHVCKLFIEIPYIQEVHVWIAYYAYIL